MIKKLIIFLLPIFINTCQKDIEPPLGLDYLPMEVGNYWQLEFSDPTSIVGMKSLDDKVYFILVHKNDTSYYRNDGGRIIVKDAIKFDLTADEGDSWNYGSYIATLISKSDTIQIKDKIIHNCYHFYFDVPRMCDEEHSIWLAPKIGFVQEQCGECENQIKKLVMAKIGTRIYDFQ